MRNIELANDPVILTSPVVLLSHTVLMFVPIAPLTVTVPPVLKVTLALPVTGPVTPPEVIFSVPLSPTVRVKPLLIAMAPIASGPVVALIRRLLVMVVLRLAPKSSVP